MTDKIELGDLAEDMITKYRGVVVGFTKHITGCDRFTLQSQDIKDGKIPDAYNFDVTTLKLIEKGVVPVTVVPLPDPVLKAGGPPTIARNDEYREEARRLLRANKDCSVHPWAAVQRVHDGGAFVEATIWVPNPLVEKAKEESA